MLNSQIIVTLICEKISLITVASAGFWFGGGEHFRVRGLAVPHTGGSGGGGEAPRGQEKILKRLTKNQHKIAIFQ